MPILLTYLEQAKLSTLDSEHESGKFHVRHWIGWSPFDLIPSNLGGCDFKIHLRTPMHLGGGKVLIFVRTRNAADELAQLVMERFGGRSDAIHGMRRQEQREVSLRLGMGDPKDVNDLRLGVGTPKGRVEIEIWI